MDYTTTSELKSYLHISGVADDTLLGSLIARASRMIDDHCGRWFYAISETRYFNAVGSNIYGRLLLVDADLQSITTLTNGDGSTVDPGDVILRPVNWPPYFGISLKQSSGLRWNYVGDPEKAISVEGVWGYSATPPEPVVHAAIRLAAWLYRQRDTGAEPAQVEVSERGVAVAPPRLPRDVIQMLGPYIRVRMSVAA